MIFACVCRRGWVLDAGADWAKPCPVCGGRSRFGTVALAKKLGVHRRDVYRVATGRAGRRVAARVFFAIAEKLPEALA